MMNEYDRLVRQAKMERAVLLGEYIGDALLWLGRLPAKITTLFSSKTDKEYISPNDVRAYARAFEQSSPSFASELKSAADRAQYSWADGAELKTK